MKHAAPRQRVRIIRLLMSVPLLLAASAWLCPAEILAQGFVGPQLGSPGMARPGTPPGPGPYGEAPGATYPPPRSAPEQIPPGAAPSGEAQRQTLPQPELMPGGATRPPIAGIRISGNKTVSENRVRSMIKSREGREFDPELIQSDVRKLASSGMFRDVQILTDTSEQGVFVTFEVDERPTIGYIKFLGNQSNRQSSLLKKSGLSVGAPMNKFQVEEARVKLEDYFRNRGHGLASVKVVEGLKPDDPGVVFMIHEGPLARVADTSFIGNTIASDARLKTQIKTKPGIFWILWGKFERSQLEEDLESLTTYYRSLGYFQARVNRILDFDEEGKWVDVQFVIDEGPRYVVRNVSFIGQTRLTAEQLATQVELESGQYFDQKKMNADVATISDVYGSQGYIHADIQADLRFLEKPGELDLVYDIREGSQYRVGKINVLIDGENPHTKHAVVMNRLSFQPGEIIDIRKIRDSERRLKYSQLFMNEPHRGVSPTITVKPPELDEIEQYAEGRSGTMRGQSPQPIYQATPPRFQPAYPSERPPEYQPPASNDTPPAYTPPVDRSESPPQYQPTQHQPTQHQPVSTPAPGQTSVYTRAQESSRQHVVAAKPSDEGSSDQHRSIARGQSPGARPQPTPGGNGTYRGAMPVSGAPLQPNQGQVAPVQYQQPTQYQQPVQQHQPQYQQQTPYQQQVPQYQPPAQQPAQPAQSGSQVYGGQGYQGPQTYLGNGYGGTTTQTVRQPGTQVLGQSPYTGPTDAYGQPPLPSAPNTGTGVIPVSRPLGGAPIYNPPLGPDAIITPNSYEDPGRRYADVMINAMEGQTGRLQLGVGVNSDAGVTGSIVIDERNFDWRRVPTSFDDVWNGKAFRGAGQGFRIEAMPGNIVQRYMVTYTDPYLFDTPLSLNLSGYLFDRIYRDWREQRIGGRTGIGYRLTPDLSTSVGLRAESVKIHDPRVTGVPELDDAIGSHGLYAANWQIAHDTRDLPFAPTEGHLFEINLEQVFGAYDYSRAEVDYRKYFLLAERPDGSGRHTLGFSGRVGFTGSDTPIFENYFAGGFSTMRGFEFRRFGPKSGDVFTGGQYRMLGSVEYMFPITADDMVKGVLFTDVGSVERTARFDADNFGVAPGLGLRISVPALGQAPIALDFAFPVNRRDSDEVQVFSFFVGMAR